VEVQPKNGIATGTRCLALTSFLKGRIDLFELHVALDGLTAVRRQQFGYLGRVVRNLIILRKIAQQSTAVRTKRGIGFLDKVVDEQCGSASCFSQGAQDNKRDGTLIPFNELKPCLRILLSAQPS
jgi:hypothetical protein